MGKLMDHRSWAETHHEMVSAIAIWLNGPEEKQPQVIQELYTSGGTNAMYDLAIDWTDEFQKKNKNREWDGDYFDEIEKFIDEKLQTKS